MRKKGRKPHQQKTFIENHELIKKALQRKYKGQTVADIKCIIELSRRTIGKHLDVFKADKEVYQVGKLYFWAHLNKALTDMVQKQKKRLGIIHQSDLLMRAVLNDPRFEKLLFEKISEGLQVREDIIEDGVLKEVKIHTFTEKIRPKKQGL